MDKKNRWGIPKISNLAHEKFHEIASDHLSKQDIETWNRESDSRGFVAHNAPDDSWEPIIGFVPDPTFYSQVTIGLAVDPGEQPEVFAKVLICREKSNEFTKFVWRPKK
ncbi:DUF440 family protein [Microbulbifer sp. PAAF003]|uniref:DUF440 family protein n=1 Tax=Microbulbifer sp. PAAF003 TaxID=3243375 RepID=UPI004039D839